MLLLEKILSERKKLQDSIIFRYPKLAPLPVGIILGSQMGEFEAEKCSERIFRFVSTGAKVCYRFYTYNNIVCVSELRIMLAR